tara:strand:- start:5101 stop:7161 length:2061 start_codon:yes stop_codon:yes gene_type:complete
MASEADILVKFGADVGPLKKGAKSASTSIAGVGTAAANNAKKMAALGAVAAVAGAALGIKLVSASMSAIDVQAKLAKQLDTSSKSIANLELAASLSGISINDVATAAKALNVKLADAAGGTGTAVEVLKDLGLTVKDLAVMDLDEKIGALNKAIKENIDPTEQAAYAADLFGTRAGAAIAMLDSETIKSASDQIERFGLAISDIDAAKVEAANDAIEILKRSTDGLVQQFTVALAPAIEAAANVLSEQFISASGDMQSGVQDAADAAIEAFADVLDGAAGLIGFIEQNQDVAKFGVMGYLLFGKKGAVLGAAIGGTFDFVKEQMDALGISTSTAMDPTLQKIDDLNEKIAYISTQFAVADFFKLDTAQGFNDQITLLQVSVQDLMSTIEDGSPAQQELNNLLAQGVENGDSLSQTMLNVAEAIRGAKSAAGEATEGGLLLPSLEAIDPEKDPLVLSNRQKLEIMKMDYDQYESYLTKAREMGAQDSVESQGSMLIDYQQFADMRLKADKVAEDKKAKTQKFYSNETLVASSKAFGDISSLMSSESKKQFEIGKKAAQAQVVVDTYASASAAFKSLAGIPIVGPALGAAAAGAAIVGGMARLNAISSSSFGGSSVSNPTAGSSGTGTSSAATADAAMAGQSAQSNAQTQSLYIEGIDPGSMFSGEQVRNLIDKINEAGSDGKQVMLV